MQQTANINALKALRERAAVESMRRTFVRHKFAGKSFFFGCITNCLVGMKMVEQKAIEIFVQAPNERTEWSATRSTPNTQTLRETRRNSNCLYPRVSMCVWYHYSGWIAYAYAQILISLWWMCARFYGFIRKRYYSMAFARVHRTKRVHTHISHSVLHVRTPSVKMFQLNFEAFVCGKAYTRRTEHNANWLSMCAIVLS